MLTLKDVHFEENFESRYLKAVEFTFQQGDRIRKMDLGLRHSSVAILLYHREKKEFLIVKQFRPAIFVNKVRMMAENLGKQLNEINWEAYDTKIGYTLELCAGLMDKPLPAKEVAREEIEEECGYSVPTDQIHPIGTYLLDLDGGGCTHYLYYAEIDESMKISEGGGNVSEGEVIYKVWISVDRAMTLLDSAPPGVAIAFNWWLQGKNTKRTVDESIWPSNFPYNMETISDFEFKENHTSKRFKPVQMRFTMNTLTRTWDLRLRNNNSAVFIFNSSTKELVLLQRFRAAAMVGRIRHLEINRRSKLAEINWIGVEPKFAYSLEPCIGEYVPGSCPEQRVREVAVTKCGYKLQKVKWLGEFIVGISLGGNSQAVYYAEVTNEDRIEGFKDREDMKALHIPLTALPYIMDHPDPIGPPGLYYGIQWILNNVQ